MLSLFTVYIIVDNKGHHDNVGYIIRGVTHSQFRGYLCRRMIKY